MTSIVEIESLVLLLLVIISAAAQAGFAFRQIAATGIGEFDVLKIAPDALLGIEFGSIAR